MNPNYEILNRKKIIIYVIVVCVVAVFVVLASIKAWDYFITKKTISLNPTNGSTIILGTQTSDETVISKIVVQTNTSKKIKLKPGLYAVKYTKGNDYQEITKTININKSITITTPDLSYTDQKLNQLLNQVKPFTQNSLSQNFDTTKYTFVDDHLYKQGNWYGGRLIPKSSGDDLRYILKKEDGTWLVIVKPTYVISAQDYSNIPKDIIASTNKYGYY